MPETWGRVVGLGSLGLALGLAMYLVENLFREASLEVIWAYNETTRVSLGAQPISVGGDIEDQIFVRRVTTPHIDDSDAEWPHRTPGQLEWHTRPAD